MVGEAAQIFFNFGRVGKGFSIVARQSKLFSGALENSNSVPEKVQPFQKRAGKREVTHVIKTVGLQAT